MYVLELRSTGRVLKRYPVSLGTNPVDRKLHYDNATTPEGRYHISYRWPKATYYKALGVSYPNAEDRRRYREAKNEGRVPRLSNGSIADIGGAIQIHGGGIANNWTWGCIALENDDIDELFEIGCIGVNTPLFITGSEIKRGDL